MAADLTNREIADLRSYFRTPEFKYPIAAPDELPDGWDGMVGVVYFNALPRLLEEVLRRRFHARSNESNGA